MDYIPENHCHMTCVNLLVEAGADVNRKGKEGRTALIQAAINDHHDCVDLLIKAGADVNQLDDYNRTALVHAAIYDHDDCVDILIKAGAAVNQSSDDGNTPPPPLSTAAFYGSAKSLEKLLSAGADMNSPHPRASNALISSVLKSQRYWERLAKDEERSHPPRNCKQEECIKMLVEAGANVNAQTDSGDSALMKASANGYKECVSLFLEAGADVNIMNNIGDTALTVAAVRGNVTVAKCLLKANCCIKKISEMVHNPLTYQIKHRQSVDKTMSRLLFAAGEVLDDDLKETMQGLMELNDVKMQLKHICRETIRKHLLELDPHQHLFGRIPLLGMPEMIKEYLLYDKSLEENESEQ